MLKRFPFLLDKEKVEVTAAGLSPILTGFPVKLYDHLIKYIKFIQIGMKVNKKLMLIFFSIRNIMCFRTKYHSSTYGTKTAIQGVVRGMCPYQSVLIEIVVARIYG